MESLLTTPPRNHSTYLLELIISQMILQKAGNTNKYLSRTLTKFTSRIAYNWLKDNSKITEQLRKTSELLIIGSNVSTSIFRILS